MTILFWAAIWIAAAVETLLAVSWVMYQEEYSINDADTLDSGVGRH